MRKSCHVPLLQALCVLCVVLGSLASVQAAGLTWNGGGADNNFSNSANWGGSALAASGDSVAFDGAVRPTPFNNQAGGYYTLSGIAFNAGASAFTVGGNWTKLTGDVVNNSAVTQTDNLGHEFHASLQFNAASGALVFGGGASLNLNGNGLTVTGGFNTDINLVVGGAGAGSTLTKSGAGTLSIKAGGSYAGQTTITGGVLEYTGSGSAYNGGTAAGQIVVESGGTLRFARHDTFGNASANPAVAITVNGGTITNTASWFTPLGAVTLNQGTIAANAGHSTWDSFLFRNTVTTVAAANSSVLSSSGANSGFHLNSTGTTFNVADGSAASDLLVSGVLEDYYPAQTGSLIKSGAGTMTLTNANTYTGTTTVSAGTLQLNNALAAGNTTITLGDANTGAANIRLGLGENIANNVVVSASGTGTATLYGTAQYKSHTGTITLNRPVILEVPTNGTSDWWYGFRTITGTGTVTIKGGGGSSSAGIGGNRVTLGGASTYADGTIIESGQLQIDTVTGAGTGGITLGNGATGSAVTQLRVGANIANPIVVSSAAPSSTAGIGTYNSLQVLGGSLQVNRPLTINGASDRLTWAGAGAVWSGAGDITVAGGRVTHEGVANTWTGNLVINAASTFQPGHAATLTAANSVTANGTLQFNNVSQTINGLSGSGLVQNITGANTLTVGAGNASTTFSGTIQNGSGALTLVKTGSGTQTLSGANTYTGNTLVSQGQLRVTGTLTGAVAGTRFIVGGGAGTNGAAVFDMGSGTSAFYADGYNNSCDIGENGGTGSLTLDSGTLNVNTRTSGSNGSIRLGTNGAAAGTLTVNNGTLNVPGRILMAANSGTANATLTINNGLVNLGTAGQGNYSDPGLGLLWVGVGTSTVNLNGGTLALYSFHGSPGSATVNLNGGTIKAQNANATFTNAAFNFNVKAGGAKIDTAGYDITFNRPLAHDTALGSTLDGGLTKLGAGTMTLNSTATYTGPTRVQAGTLKLAGDYNRIWTSSSVAVSAGATLACETRAQHILDLDLAGGTLAGSGDATYGSWIFDRHVTAGGQSATSTMSAVDMALNVAGGTRFTVAPGAANGVDLDVTGTIGNKFQGSAGLIKAGAGLMRINGIHGYTGPTSVEAGTLELRNQGQGSGDGWRSATTLAGGTQLWLTATSGQTSDLRTNVTGAGALVKKDAGTVRIGTWSGLPLLNYSGNTTVEAGHLSLQGQAAGRGFDSTGNLVVNQDATFSLSGLAAQQASNAARFGALAGQGTISGVSGSPYLDFGNGDKSGTFSGAITGSLNLNKIGGGTQILDGLADTYTGTTTVSGGRLLVNGTHTGSGAYTVLDGATLGGTGIIAAEVRARSGGQVAPGTSPGDLTVGNLVLESGSLFGVEVGGLDWDTLFVNGSVNLADSLLNLSTIGRLSEFGGSTYVILDNDGSDPIGGIFRDRPEGSSIEVAGNQFILSYLGGSGNDVMLTAVPEPATLSLLALAAGGVGGYLRRRRTR